MFGLSSPALPQPSSFVANHRRGQGATTRSRAEARNKYEWPNDSSLRHSAFRIASDTGSGIAVTLLPSADVVARFGAKLCAIERAEEAAAADLASDRGERVLGRRRSGAGVLRRIRHAASGATVRVSHQHSAGLVHRNVIEVQQIAARIAAATIPDATALHRIGRRSIHGRPGAAGIVGKGDVQMPDPEKVGGLCVTSRLRSQESEGGAVVIAGDDFGEFGVLYTKRRARILGFRPVLPAIGRNGNLRVPVGIYVTQVNRVVCTCRDRGIASRADAFGVGNGFHNPIQSIVGRYGNADSVHAVAVHATLVRNVSGAVGRNAHMAVEAAASSWRHGQIHTVNGSESIDRNTGPER